MIVDGVYHTAEEFDKFLEVAESEDRENGTRSFKDDTLNFLNDLAEDIYIVSIDTIRVSFLYISFNHYIKRRKCTKNSNGYCSKNNLVVKWHY